MANRCQYHLRKSQMGSKWLGWAWVVSGTREPRGAETGGDTPARYPWPFVCTTALGASPSNAQTMGRPFG
jgi:hypothetical protein